MPRLPSAAHGAVFGVTMAFLYSGLMSGVFMARAYGLTPEAFAPWLRTWALAFVIAAPAGVVLRPVANAVADIVAPPRSGERP
ncbi:DUF2798 domain-containing protein [Blastomonas sp. UPD001]|uniref:DUF2798 domain-containing protein n=1 Tax=Blastomonas sp. UPD001 TaxID=2217673 RepID=UPI000E34A239|nr:DUF2798 domain-containing protein [Blastomonas sp. UPD001]